MTVDLGTRAVSVVDDEPSAAFIPGAVREFELTPADVVSEPWRSVVELRRIHGGRAPHVVLGARYEPDHDDHLVVRVGERGPRSVKRSCRVRLGERRLIPGLPTELVEPAIRGIMGAADVGPGSIIIDRAGFDPVETSPIIVEFAADLLGRLLAARAGRFSADELREWLESLP